MKNFKLSLLLLAAMAAQPFAADANMFARFAALAKTKAAAVKSFFSPSNTRRWSFVNPFSFGKKAVIGAVATAPLWAIAPLNAVTAGTSTAAKDAKPAQAEPVKTISINDAYQYFMVSVIEKKGPARKESCSSISIKPSTYSETCSVITMRCPRTTFWGHKSGNKTLHAVYEQQRLTKIKQKLAEQGFLNELDRKELNIEGDVDRQEIEQQLKEANSHIQALTGARIIDKASFDTTSIILGGFTGETYALHTVMEKSKYRDIAASFHAQDKAEQEALKQQEAAKKA